MIKYDLKVINKLIKILKPGYIPGFINTHSLPIVSYMCLAVPK